LRNTVRTEIQSLPDIFLLGLNVLLMQSLDVPVEISVIITNYIHIITVLIKSKPLSVTLQMRLY
jgi:hypothetical protein